jgi:hypothetical protein
MYFAPPHLKIIFELYIPFVWINSTRRYSFTELRLTNPTHTHVSHFRDKILVDL